MTKLSLPILFISVSVSIAAAQDADTVYTNGRIYTVNEAQPWVEAVAIKDGKFIAVGTNAEISAVTGGDSDVIDLKGGFAMPGIHDTHIHTSLVYSHEEAGRLLFEESNSPDQVIEIVKEYAAANPDLR